MAAPRIVQPPPPSPTQAPGRAHRHRFETPFWRRVMLGGIKHIPQPLQRLSMPLWAGIFYGLVPTARRTVEANLERVLGPSTSLTRHARSYRLFVNYAQSITNMYALYLGLDLPVDPQFDSLGRAQLNAVLDAGQGAILVTGHLGSWALGAFVMKKFGLPSPTLAMAEEPNAALQQFEQRMRSQLRIVYTTGSPFASLELAAILRRGEMVAMQLDRHLGGASVRLPFFGAEASFPLGPATLARVTGAPLVPVFMVREGVKGFRVRMESPIRVARTAKRDDDLRRATAEVVRVYERFVRRYPYQWFNFHDFWARG